MTASEIKRCETTRIWRLANRERAMESSRRYRIANPEKCRKATREWCLANKERRMEKVRAWRKAHPEAAVANRKNVRAWALAHPEKRSEAQARRRARQSGAARIEKIDRLEIYARDGGLCGICGKRVPRSSFTLDHITPLAKGGNHTYDNLTVAHQSCNFAKRDGHTPTQRPLFARLGG